MIESKLPQIVSESIPGEKSCELLEQRRQYVAQGIGNITPLFIKEAKGALIKDVDDNVFLDFAAGIGVQNVGHCDEEVVDAICEQAKQYIHPCFHVNMYEPYIELAKKLTSLMGDTERKVMLSNSGAEAVENAIKIARKYTGKTGVISLETAFHGRTYMAMSITSKVKPYKNGFGPFATDTYKIPSAYCYRCPMNCSYPECNLACANKLETLLKGEWDADTIACLIVEPLQGEGGFITPPQGYLERLQEICNKNNILFIVDEVQSGFARTGEMFAYQHSGLEPDMMTLSKSMGAGVPISAIIGKAEIMDGPNSGEIGGTFAGSPLGCASALKVIEKIERDNLAERANKIGEAIKATFTSLKQDYEVIGEVRGRGAMIGIEFVTDAVSKEPNPTLTKEITAYCLQKGLIVINAGIYNNVIRFLPPLVMSDEQVEYAMDILSDAVRKYAK